MGSTIIMRTDSSTIHQKRLMVADGTLPRRFTVKSEVSISMVNKTKSTRRLIRRKIPCPLTQVKTDIETIQADNVILSNLKKRETRRQEAATLKTPTTTTIIITIIIKKTGSEMVVRKNIRQQSLHQRSNRMDLRIRRINGAGLQVRREKQKKKKTENTVISCDFWLRVTYSQNCFPT